MCLLADDQEARRDAIVTVLARAAAEPFADSARRVAPRVLQGRLRLRFNGKVDGLAYLEGRVCAALDRGHVAVFLTEAIAGARVRDGEHVAAETLRDRMPHEGSDQLDRNLERQLADVRRRRRIPR